MIGKNHIKISVNRQEKTLIEKICRVFRLLLLPALLREILAKRKVVVINYHNPSRSLFKSHLSVFLKQYNFISMDTLRFALKTRNFSSLPPKAIVLTFDDGHLGNSLLLEDLGEARVPFLIYAVAGVVGTQRGFWFRDAGLSKEERDKMKLISNTERLQRLERFYNWNNEDDKSGTALTIENLQMAIRHGGTIGSHTLFHPTLTRCTRDEMKNEIRESKRTLEALLDIEVAHFAYTDGLWNEIVREEVINAGYKTARSTSPGWIKYDNDPYALPTLGIDDNAGINKALVQASGLWWFIKGLLKS